ncbi:MAG: hypothetical protein K0S26_2481, partial [Bacteroidota bacterium]|nr:hypothetical protein [Bacteroidota bacterium]
AIAYHIDEHKRHAALKNVNPAKVFYINW